MEEFVSKFNNWKEMTYASPKTKRHLGHYKSLVRIIVGKKVESKPNSIII
jgi:hypothetical protein